LRSRSRHVACDNLLRGTTRNPWLEALLFGLLHGSGYFLADALAGEPLLTSAFVGFHAGVELGQLAFAGACVLVFALVFRAWRRAQPSEGRAPASSRRACACCARSWSGCSASTGSSSAAGSRA